MQSVTTLLYLLLHLALLLLKKKAKQLKVKKAHQKSNNLLFIYVLDKAGLAPLFCYIRFYSSILRDSYVCTILFICWFIQFRGRIRTDLSSCICLGLFKPFSRIKNLALL